MDKNTKNFIVYSGTLVFIFVFFLLVLYFAYRYFTLAAYSGILFFLIMLTIILIICAAVTITAVIAVSRTRHIPAIMRIPVRLGLKIMLPVTAVAAGLFKGSRDSVRGLYVDVNNIMVESGAIKFKPDQVLVLLPHCLQSSSCNYKITNDINNCRQCGNCCISQIVKLTNEKGVKAIVVTGGTAARSLVKQEKPKVLVSVACERDLSAGIADVGGIPVLGVLNERPNGPCKDTTVNIELLKNKLEFILGEKEINGGNA